MDQQARSPGDGKVSRDQRIRTTCGATVQTTLRAVTWTLLTDVPATLVLLQLAADKLGFKAVTLAPTEVVIAAPPSLWTRRRAARLNGLVSSRGAGLEIVWIPDGPDASGAAHLLSLETALPEDVFDYRGVIEAAADAKVAVLGRQDIRSLVNVLRRGETVLAIGSAFHGVEAGKAILTDRRFLFATVVGQSGAPALELPLGAIAGVSLGKKTSGETLTLATARGSHFISNLGHGVGHSFVKRFRVAQNG